eukprot:3514458-Amphidinium_carterae.1
MKPGIASESDYGKIDDDKRRLNSLDLAKVAPVHRWILVLGRFLHLRRRRAVCLKKQVIGQGNTPTTSTEAIGLQSSHLEHLEVSVCTAASTYRMSRLR